MITTHNLSQVKPISYNGLGTSRILLLTQVLPYPPDSGPKVKTFYLLKYLAQQHRVTLVSFIRSENEVAQAEALRPYCEAIHTVPMVRSRWRDGWHLISSFLAGRSFIISRDHQRAMHHLLAKLCQQVPFDVVHADQLNMAQFALPLNVPARVLDEHNAVWTIFARLARQLPWGLHRLLLNWEWRRLRRYEGDVCRQFDVVTAVSAEDVTALSEAMGQAATIPIIPIAIDTDLEQPVQRQTGATDIVCIGTMYWPPNVDGVLWFSREVFPLIKAQAPQARFVIVGARPPQEVVSLGEQDPNIIVTGYVPDLGDILRQSAMMIIPLRAGGGMRVKILNGLAQGLPMVSTTLGAEGIDVRQNEHILLADSPTKFAAAVLRLLTDRPFADRLGLNARRLAEEKYDYRQACRTWDGIYASLANNHRKQLERKNAHSFC